MARSAHFSVAAILAAAVTTMPHANGNMVMNDASLLQREAIENVQCRGGTSDNQTTDWHCGARDLLDEMLYARGWCYLSPGQVMSDAQWHKCRPGDR